MRSTLAIANCACVPPISSFSTKPSGMYGPSSPSSLFVPFLRGSREVLTLFFRFFLSFLFLDGPVRASPFLRQKVSLRGNPYPTYFPLESPGVFFQKNLSTFLSEGFSGLWLLLFQLPPPHHESRSFFERAQISPLWNKAFFPPFQRFVMGRVRVEPLFLKIS